MSWLSNIFLYGVCLLLANAARADVMVQLNINRPINDVSDKFISFTIKPEDLYKALDSSNRKTITRMASMLSHSRVKFVGDYDFAAKSAGIRLRNPTKIVWKGFNKWTKAVNWSMIIPVPYKPENWDPMETLKILNTSQMVDIDEAVWQLGTDFGTARAADYVSELRTFNVMVESFKQKFTNWQTMGADISAGSSPAETRRYVDMSRDLNVAYGWIQSEDMFSGNSVASPLDNLDPALKILFKSKVPVWLTLPKKTKFSLHMDDEVTEGLNWAQSMGEAANVGFDTIFKPLTLDDMERPKYGFYITALFKKVMGSRVYPARPLGMFDRRNKLYTHCANMVSGGLAFMVVNKLEQPLQIAIRSTNKLEDTEVWQYALTMQDGQVMLNNNYLHINASLMPEVRRKNTNAMLHLSTPGFSVSFWVLPNANLEHCHFTEVGAGEISEDSSNQKIKRYSSSDRLLQKLIKESTKPSYTPFADLLSRHRRSLDSEDRFKRFVLKGTKEEPKPSATFADSLVQEIKSPLKRDIFSPERRKAALEWLSNIFKEPMSLDVGLLKRNARQSDLQKGPFFMTRDGKRTAFTKKITEIKKPEKKTKKLIPEDQEFDEEKFFKNVGQQVEPEYVRIPEGDVFLRNIASVDGDEEELTIETQGSASKGSVQKKEIVSEMKPLRLLPTEFFETLPPKPVQALPPKLDMGSNHNSLLLADPFGRATISKESMQQETHTNYDDDELVNTQLDVSQRVLNNGEAREEHEDSIRKDVENLLEADEDEKSLQNSKSFYNNFLSSDNLNYFGDSPSKAETDESIATQDKSRHADTSIHEKFEEIPWWDLSAKRMKRSLDTHHSADSWHNNMISKDDDPITAADELSPTRLRHFEHKVNEVVRSTNSNGNRENDDDDDFLIGKKIIRTFGEQATKLVDIFSHHASAFYNTFTKHLDGAVKETTTEGNLI